MRQNIRTVEVDFMRGAIPNLNEVDLASGGALDRAENVDFNRKFRTMSKMNGVSQRSPDLGGAVSSLHYFDYVTLYGANAREVLALEGGQLHRIDSPSATTVMGSGFTDEHLSAVTFNDRIHFASENNDPKKYDGAAVRTWGVYAPGTEPIEQVTFDSATGWTASGTNSVTAQTTIRKRGTGALMLTKSDAGGANCTIENTGLSIATSGVSLAYVWIYFPHETFDVLAAANCVRVIYGGAAYADSCEWFFDKADLFPGWNLLPLDYSVAIFGGLGAPNPSTSFLVGFTTASAATVGVSAVVDFFYTVSSGSLTAAVGAAGALTGTFRYKVTYLTKYGVESNAGAVSNSVTLAAQRASLTAIPVSSDTQVIARRIYRDANDGVYKFVHEIGDNSTTTYTDNNATLATVLPPEAASTTNDASPPERMICVVGWQGFIFGINAANQIELNITNAADPETFPLVSTLTFQDALTALAVHPAGLLCFSSDRTYVLTGSGTTSDPFVAIEANNEVGCNHWLSVATVRDGVVVHHEGRLYLMGMTQDSRVGTIEKPWLLNARMLRSDQSLWRPSIVVGDRVRDRILHFFPLTAGGAEYNNGHALNFTSVAISQVSGDGPGINPQDIRLGVHSTIVNPFTAFKSFAVVENSSDESELWAALADGYVVCLANQAGSTGYLWQNNGATATLTSIVSFMVPMHAQPGGRGDIRYFDLDCEGDAGAQWSVAITYYDSPMRTTSLGTVPTFTVDGSKSTMTAIPRGARGSIAYVTMTNTVAFRSTISRIRCHVIPRYAPRGVRA